MYTTYQFQWHATEKRKNSSSEDTQKTHFVLYFDSFQRSRDSLFGGKRCHSGISKEYEGNPRLPLLWKCTAWAWFEGEAITRGMVEDCEASFVSRVVFARHFDFRIFCNRIFKSRLTPRDTRSGIVSRRRRSRLPMHTFTYLLYWKRAFYQARERDQRPHGQ